MNQRIEQLYLQAHEQKPIIVMDSETCEPTHKLGHGGVPMYHMVFNPEKFAELIVRECISALDEADGSVHHRECLLEHFGVEE